VQQTLTSDYVMVSLYNDDGTKLPEPIVLPDGSKLRTLGDKIRQYQIENFQNNGAPYYVLMTADGKVLDQMGYDGSGSAYTEKLASFLRKGLGK
jgi:thiol:disulfide interchange protein DsbD